MPTFHVSEDWKGDTKVEVSPTAVEFFTPIVAGAILGAVDGATNKAMGLIYLNREKIESALDEGNIPEVEELIDVLTFGASSLEAELSNGKRDEASLIGQETMPLNQDIKKRQSKADVRLKIRPGFVSHVFEVTNRGEHRQDGFDDHAHIPFTAPTDPQILRLPIELGKAGIREDYHVMPEFIDEMLKGGAIVDIGGIALPINDASQVVKDETELATHNPTLIREALLADLRLATSFTAWVEQFNPVTVDHADQAR